MVDIRNTLKEYFKQGAKPTGSQFAEWIDKGLFNAVHCKWSELKGLRDKSKLNPGQFYRITDYETIVTTNSTNIKSMGHKFDVVVVAISNNILSEQALAIHNQNDVYFQNNKLSAWRLWYTLDNDTSRFRWVDELNGKGVIYRMIDEYNNDAPYDFKNIVTKLSGLDYFTYLFDYTEDGSHVDGSTRTASFTHNTVRGQTGQVNTLGSIRFTENCHKNLVSSFGRVITIHGYGNQVGSDCSYITIQGNNNEVGSNSSYITIQGTRNRVGSNSQQIEIHGNDNEVESNCRDITLTSSSTGNTFEHGCYEIEVGSGSNHNSFGKNCNTITLAASCTNNTFYTSCRSITLGTGCNRNLFIMDSELSLGEGCNDNSFDTNCVGITLRDSCTGNKFGPNCSNTVGKITFGSECKFNSLGPGCTNINLGNKSSRNSFGNYCRSITLAASNYSNSLGNDCYSIALGTSNKFNSFGNQCRYITLGNNYTSCKIGNNCSDLGVVISSSWNIRHFCCNIEFLSGVQNVYLGNNDTASEKNQVQNIVVTNIVGSGDSERLVDVPVNSVPTLVVGLSSNGGYPKVVNLFDLVE